MSNKMVTPETSCIEGFIFLSTCSDDLYVTDQKDNTSMPVIKHLNREQLSEIVEVYNNWKAGNFDDCRISSIEQLREVKWNE